MKKASYYLLLILFPILTLTSEQKIWSPLFPVNVKEEVYAILFSDGNPDVIYGVEKSCIIKTTDRGKTWSRISSFYDEYTEEIHSIVIHPQNPEIIYIGAQNGLYKSTDGGGTWQQIFKGIYEQPWGGSYFVNTIDLDPTNSEVIYIGTKNGIYKLPKAGDKVGGLFGKNYNNISGNLPSSTSITSIAIDTVNKKTLYIGTEGHGIFKSVNEGKTWLQITEGLPQKSLGFCKIRDIVLSSVSPSTIYCTVSGACAGKQGLYKSTDNGVNWFLVGFEGSTIYKMKIKYIDGQNEEIYLSTGALYKSSDYGETWQEFRSNNQFTTSVCDFDIINDTVYIATEQGMFAGPIEIAPPAKSEALLLIEELDKKFPGGISSRKFVQLAPYEVEQAKSELTKFLTNVMSDRGKEAYKMMAIPYVYKVKKWEYMKKLEGGKSEPINTEAILLYYSTARKLQYMNCEEGKYWEEATMDVYRKSQDLFKVLCLFNFDFDRLRYLGQVDKQVSIELHPSYGDMIYEGFAEANLAPILKSLGISMDTVISTCTHEDSLAGATEPIEYNKNLIPENINLLSNGKLTLKFQEFQVKLWIPLEHVEGSLFTKNYNIIMIKSDLEIDGKMQKGNWIIAALYSRE